MSHDNAIGDISALVAAICETAGVDPHHVREITITPRRLTIALFKTDGDGRKYFAGDIPASEIHHFAVRT